MTGRCCACPQIQARNLEPALRWVEEKREDLAAARQSYESFEFQLHRLQFLRILTQQGASGTCLWCTAVPGCLDLNPQKLSMCCLVRMAVGYKAHA